MNQIQKLLKKLSEKERKLIKEILSDIQSGHYKNLDIKKLKGETDLFRVRKGNLRIIFTTEKGVRILSIGRRNDTTYNL